MDGYNFICYACKEEFTSVQDEDWNDQKANNEMIANGFEDEPNLTVVCDDCYNEIMRIGVQSN